MKLPKKSFHTVLFLLKLYIFVAFRQKVSDNKRKKRRINLGRRGYERSIKKRNAEI